MRPIGRQSGWSSPCAKRLPRAVAVCGFIAAAPFASLADNVPPPDAAGGSPNESVGAMSRWLNPSTAPFIPVPLIGSDPNSGTTLGLLPVWLSTDDDHEIRQIVAPDVLHNPYFGYGVDARIYEYTSRDSQWSIDSGIKEKVERDVDAEYQSGRLRDQRWSFNFSAIFNRSGTPRFYGVGNESLQIDETNYTNTQELAQVQVGLNLNHDWQILYTGRYLSDDVTPGTLSGIASIEERFGRILGVGTNTQMLNRLAVIFDTRDDLVVPSRGVELVAYGGGAARSGILNDSMYDEAGVDGRNYWPVTPDTVIAAHVALRYLPSSHEVPFWALSSLGGGVSQIGGEQPLRGFGEGRFYDRNSFSSSLELRRNIWSFDAVSTRVDLEMAPFVDLGRVFSRTNADPLEQLHHVFGVGFRGIAKPFVVGKVDIGYGSEGVAIFTGLNYPF